MSLKIKFIILISTLFIGLLLVNLSTFTLIIFPTFEELESREAKKNLGRVLDILESDFKDMDAFAYDWASWDDTYKFIKDRNQHYIDSNMYPEYSVNQNHDLYYIWDSKGKPVINKALNEEGTAFELFSEFPAEGLPKDHPFSALNSVSSNSSGLIQTKRGPMIIAARPIIKSSLEGPIRGVLAMGRYLDKKLIESLIKRSRLNVDVLSFSEKQLLGSQGNSLRNIKPGKVKTIISEDKKNSLIYSSYPDIFGNPLILIRVSMPRDIVAQGKSTIKYGVGMALVSGLVLMVTLLIIFQRSILNPLSSLATNIVRLGRRENVSSQLPLDRSDELGVVANSILSTYEDLQKLILQKEISERKILAFSEKLQQRNQELQSFASIASHDLQEPLRKIIIFGDRLATRIPETDEQGNDYLIRLQKSALRMRKLIEDLLQYTQLSSKPRPFESLNLNKVVETVLDDLETRISETQGAVNIVDLPVIEGDAVQFHQLFLNLIGNALKFHRDGIPPVVNLDSVKEENGFWGISVEDNGIGVDKEHVDKIFQPFERLHGRTTYEGTGIGLTICNKIVSRHGGKITLKRQSTNGIIFHITLPEKQNEGKI
jgi:signal transduction histidine kinase